MASSFMMRLGEFTFSLDAAAYQQLRRQTDYRWPAQQRIGPLPARQFTGPGQDTISLNGTLYPQFRGGTRQVEALRQQAGHGNPLRLMDGAGRPWGQWIITRIEETLQVLFADGTPRRIHFRLELARYGQDHEGYPE